VAKIELMLGAHDLSQPLRVVPAGLVHLHIERSTRVPGVETGDVEALSAQFMHEPSRHRPGLDEIAVNFAGVWFGFYQSTQNLGAVILCGMHVEWVADALRTQFADGRVVAESCTIAIGMRVHARWFERSSPGDCPNAAVKQR
jgi:hypothetical protein